MKALRVAAAALALCGCFGGRQLASPLLAELRDAFAAGRYAEAAKRLEGPGLRGLPARELPRGYELLGQSLDRLGRTDSALRTYQTGVALYPKDLNLLTHLANLLHRGAMDGEARPFYERVLKLSPDNAAAHLGLAEAERRLGFLDRAAGHYEDALKTWGDQGGIWRDYAEVLGDARRPAEALKAVERSLALIETGSARLDQARFLWRLGRKAEAFDALARAQALEPANAALLHQRSLWQLEAGDLEQAEAAAAGVLKDLPDDPLALWLRGSIAIRRGKPEQARGDLERAAGQRDSPFVAMAAEGLLKQLR